MKLNFSFCNKVIFYILHRKKTENNVKKPNGQSKVLIKSGFVLSKKIVICENYTNYNSVIYLTLTRVSCIILNSGAMLMMTVVY